MKKFSLILLVLAMLMSFCACGTNNDTLVIGIDDQFPPMGFRDENNAIVGFDIDLAKAVAEEMGVEIEFKVIDWSAKEQELKNGNIDIIWNGYTITDERKEKVDFTAPYLANAQVVVVKADSAYNTVLDLAGKVIAAQTDSSAENAIKSNEVLYNAINREITQYADNVTALTDVKAGRVDALVVDKVVAEYYLAKEEGTYRILAESLEPEEYGIGVLKGNTELLNDIQTALNTLIANGKAAEISTTWFGENKVLSSEE